MTEEHTEDVQPQENEQDVNDDTGNDTDGNGDDQDFKALYEETKAELEKTRADKNGLIKKVKSVKSTPKSTPATNVDATRLDKIELRQLDNSLTSDEINKVLKIKSAEGYEDISEALNDPMVQSWLTANRAKGEKEERIKKATPSDNTKSPSSNSQNKGIKSSRDWLKNGVPGNNTDEVAGIFSNMLAE